MKALILAGGRGSRLNEFTKNKNKSMIKLFEKPLIEYNLEHAIEAGVSEIIIVVCYKKEEIMRNIGKSYKGIKVKYIQISKEEIKKGLVTGIESAKKAIGESDFILMLADEIIINAKLKEMLERFRKEELFAVCGIIFESDLGSISKTYTAMTNEKSRAFRLIEKPKVKINNIKGTGHCILKNEILTYISRTPVNAFRNQKELVDLIQVAIDDGKKVEVYPISKDYVNINTFNDLNLAKEILKKRNPKVLIVHNQMKFFGGAELLIVELANWLTKMGIKNDILTLSKSKEVESRMLNTELIVPKNDLIIIPPGYKNIKDIFKAIILFRKELKKIKGNYDVINFHDFPVTWSLWPYKKPSVWFMNQPPGLWSKPDAGFFYKLLHKFRIILDNFIIRKSIDILCVLDEFNKQRARERYRRDSQIVYCGINYNFFSKGNAERARKKYNLKNKFVVLQSGQMTEIKNQLESIKTINKLKDKIPNILLILTGEAIPEYKNKLDDYIQKNKLEKYVLFISWFEDRKELVDLYKAADVGLFPIGEQGGWIAPLEMVCAGIPIVVSNDMGSSSIVKENNLGIVTKNYPNAILEIYNNEEKYRNEFRKGALFIRDNLSWKQYTERMVKAFRKAWKKYQ